MKKHVVILMIGLLTIVLLSGVIGVEAEGVRTGEKGWASNGPSGGYVNSIAQAPGNPDIMVAATGQIYLPLILNSWGQPVPTATPTATPTPTPTVTPTPGQQTVTLTSIADAAVLEGYPTTNVGDTDDMWAGYDDSLDPDGEIVRSLVKFDVSGIPNGVTIQNARLRVRYRGYWEFPGWVDTITAYQAQGDWQEMSVTWNNKPGFGASYDSVDIPADENWGWRELDVRDLVQGWVDGSFANDGIMLRGEEAAGAESSWRSFSTREDDHPPELVVTYGAAVNMEPKRYAAPETSKGQSVSITDQLDISSVEVEDSGGKLLISE